MTTITQAISALSTAPSTSDPTTFASRADAFLADVADMAVELETFRGQANTVAGEVNANAVAAAADAVSTDADAVSTAADAAATAADAAQTAQDAVATAADRVQTGLDAVATAADRVAVADALAAASIPASASQVEAEAGTEAALRAWSPLRVAQAIDALAQDILVSGTNIKTLDGVSLLGSGDLSASPGDHAIVVTTGNGSGSTNIRIRRFTTTQSSVGTAITYADSAANGASFTINESGLYEIYYLDGRGATTGDHGISLNSAQLTTAIGSITAADRLGLSIPATNTAGAVTRVVRLAATDVIRPHHVGCDLTAAESTVFSIRKVGL